MDERQSSDTFRQLRVEARGDTAGTDRPVEQWARAVLETADLIDIARLEQRLAALSQGWAVHQRPLATRLPLFGPLLSWLGARLARFFLQNQVLFNAEAARLLQELHQAQQILSQEQIDRSDDLFSRLEERILALEARIRDLERENYSLRQR